MINTGFSNHRVSQTYQYPKREFYWLKIKILWKIVLMVGKFVIQDPRSN